MNIVRHSNHAFAQFGDELLLLSSPEDTLSATVSYSLSSQGWVVAHRCAWWAPVTLQKRKLWREQVERTPFFGGVR